MADRVKRKLLVCDQVGYADPFRELFDEVIHPKTTKELMNGLKECTTVMFTGGEDVSPHLYGEVPGRATHPNPIRDRFEQMVWKIATEEGKSFIGICRGLQFLHVMNGGKLVQDTTKHTGTSHMIQDLHDNRILMTSVHHQMVRPETVEGSVVVAKTALRVSDWYRDGDDVEIYENKEAALEPEIVWYPKNNAIGFQGHPEMSSSLILHAYCRSVVDHYLFDNPWKPSLAEINHNTAYAG